MAKYFVTQKIFRNYGKKLCLRNFGQKSEFWSKNTTLDKHYNFDQRSKFWPKK